MWIFGLIIGIAIFVIAFMSVFCWILTLVDKPKKEHKEHGELKKQKEQVEQEEQEEQEESRIITAKNHFDQLILLNEEISEKTIEECESKMIALQTNKITFAIGWLAFWLFFGIGIGFGLCLYLGLSNLYIRVTYKSQELTRLQNKINNFVIQEIFKDKD